MVTDIVVVVIKKRKEWEERRWRKWKDHLTEGIKLGRAWAFPQYLFTGLNQTRTCSDSDRPSKARFPSNVQTDFVGGRTISRTAHQIVMRFFLIDLDLGSNKEEAISIRSCGITLEEPESPWLRNSHTFVQSSAYFYSPPASFFVSAVIVYG